MLRQGMEFTYNQSWIAGISILVLLLVLPAHTASVLSVGDGDTITDTEGARTTRVRLACIDSSETSQTPYGIDSRQALRGLLPIGTEVTV